MDVLFGKLALALAPGVGPTRFKEVLAFDQELRWCSDPRFIQQLPIPDAAKNFIKKPDARVNKILSWAEQDQHHLICVDDDRYPTLLKEIHDPPPFLYIMGAWQNLHEPQLGVVGCREMSAYGQMLAFRFAKELAMLGITITSGLAFGIDGMAHQGALQANGRTNAVLGTGLEMIYPKAHTQLAKDIFSQGGALLSEFPPDTGIKREHFPQRNRIISGLSLGILVIEAAQKSGSLITAKYALEQNRPVFAVPGSIDSPQSRGCHQLLREGARLVECTHDILEELYQPLSEWLKIPQNAAPLDRYDKIDKIPLDLLGELSFNTPTSFDELYIISAKAQPTLQEELLALELAGKVKRVPGGYIKTRQP